MKIYSSNYTIQTPPTGEVITLEQAKAFCKIDTDADDLVVGVMISAAVESCQRITNRTLLPTVFLGEFENHYYDREQQYPFVDIRRSPVTSVTSVKVHNGTDFAEEEHYFRNKEGFPRVSFIDGHNFYYFDRVPYPIQLEFTAGYEEVPAPLLNAIKAHVLFLYENRGDVTPDGKVGIPVEVDMLYRQYRVVGTF